MAGVTFSPVLAATVGSNPCEGGRRDGGLGEKVVTVDDEDGFACACYVWVGASEKTQGMRRVEMGV